MKKKIIIGIIVACLIASVIVLFQPRVSIDPAEGGSVKFLYGWTQIRAVMDNEDTEKIAEILNGKRTYSDIYSNKFSEDVSVTIDSLTFCPARDMSPVIYVQEKDRYITLSGEEMNTIRTILGSYGFTFPCP